MDLLTSAFVNLRERLNCFRPAQTLTEYTLIFAAVAIVAFGAYKLMGNSTASLASGLDSDLTNA